MYKSIIFALFTIVLEKTIQAQDEGNEPLEIYGGIGRNLVGSDYFTYIVGR